jgi:uncharacterized protein (DUF934 family)
MPLLDQNSVLSDPWVRGMPGDGTTHLLVDLADLDAALDARKDGQNIGIVVPNVSSANSLAGTFNRVSLIAVDFPSFTDGRGFSIGRQLRLRGFKGRLRAVGPLIPDQFAYVLALGFDEIDVPQAIFDRAPIAIWQAAARSISHGYQRGLADQKNILDQRREARRINQK